MADANYLSPMGSFNALNDKMSQLITAFEQFGGDDGGPIITSRDFISLSGVIVTGGSLAAQLLEVDSTAVSVGVFNPDAAPGQLWVNYNTGETASGDPTKDTPIAAGTSFFWSVRGIVPIPKGGITIFSAFDNHAYMAFKA